jgi:opacity protein-like surface antigen
MEAAYKINEKFSTSFSIDYRGGFSNKFYTTVPQEDYREEKSQRADVYTLESKSLASMLSLYYNIAEINKITPYITIGTGVAKNTTNYKINYNSTELDPAADIVYSKGKKINLAWKLGLGAKYTMNKNFDLDLRYQYTDLGRITTGKTASLNGSPHESTPTKTGKLKSNEVLLGITYKF